MVPIFTVAAIDAIIVVDQRLLHPLLTSTYLDQSLFNRFGYSKMPAVGASRERSGRPSAARTPNYLY